MLPKNHGEIDLQISWTRSAFNAIFKIKVLAAALHG
jgi:hypothetical protein